MHKRALPVTQRSGQVENINGQGAAGTRGQGSKAHFLKY